MKLEEISAKTDFMCGQCDWICVLGSWFIYFLESLLLWNNWFAPSDPSDHSMEEPSVSFQSQASCVSWPEDSNLFIARATFKWYLSYTKLKKGEWHNIWSKEDVMERVTVWHSRNQFLMQEYKLWNVTDGTEVINWLNETGKIARTLI